MLEGQTCPIHLPGYQARDFEVIDYEMYRDAGSGLCFRGPRPELSGPHGFFACIGAAQTFGCFCERPFPKLLEQELRLPALNLGYGGAAASFFVQQPGLLELVNQARFVVVQIMSGRSESNRMFESGGLEFLRRRSDGAKLSANNAYAELLRAESDTWPLPPRLSRAVRVFAGPRALRELLAETRHNWVASYRELLRAIRVPKLLLWFSRRAPWYQRTERFFWWWQRYDHANAMLGDYPQLVDQAMVRAIRPYADAYVRCVTRRGSPQALVSRFHGGPVVVDHSKDRPDLAGFSSTNAYYPSPEMHEDAARALLEPCRRLARATPRRAAAQRLAGFET